MGSFPTGNHPPFRLILYCTRLNVDIVLENPYDWSSIKTDSYDVVISGQTFEHTEFFWITLAEMIRVLKVDGILCIIAPNGVGEHRCPVDCYRFFSDGMVAFARYFDLEIIHVDTNCAPKPTYKHLRWYSHKKADSMLIAKKRYAGIARVIDLSKYRCVPINQNDFSSQMVPYRALSYLSKFIVKYYYFYDRLKILLYYLRVGFPHK